MEVCSKMPRQSRRLFEEDVSRIESEHTIQMMEAELEYHRKIAVTFENTLISEQKHLSLLTRRQRRDNRMQNDIRDAIQHSRGDDFE